MPILNDELKTAINERDGIKASAIIQASPDAINGKKIKDKKISNLNLHDIVIKDVKWQDFEISNSTFENVRFSDSNFKNASFIDSTFKNCTFSNVTMEHSNDGKSFMERLNQATFTNCLFLSTIFNNGCAFYSTALRNSKEGSSLTFKNVHFGVKLDRKNIVFNGSKFDNLTIENSSAKDADLGRSIAKTLLLNNNKNFEKVSMVIDNADSITITNNKDFALSLAGDAKSVYVDNNEDFSLGINVDADNIEIRNIYGKKGKDWGRETTTNGVNFSGGIMENILIDQVKNTDIILGRGKINNIKIMNGQGHKFVAGKMDIDRIELSNYVIDKIGAFDTVVSQFVANDVTIKSITRIRDFTIKNKQIANFNVPKQMIYEDYEEQGKAFWKEFWATEHK